MGQFKNKDKFLIELNHFPIITEATHEEAIHFILKHSLPGKGIGWIDAHLLASCFLVNAKIYTKDKAVRKISDKLKCLAN